MRITQIRFITVIIFAGLFVIVSCKRIADEDRVVNFYKNPNFHNYKVKKFALLPMAPDDTTNFGTFYSTNYFYNRLRENYQLDLIDIDKFVSSDSFAIAQQLKYLVLDQKLNLDSLYHSDLGKFLLNNECDAILLGNVTDMRQFYYSWHNSYSQLMITTVTTSTFNYFMCSLDDGAILWAANIHSFATKMSPVFSSTPEYPPLDEAISYGIDKLLEKLEDERILVYQVK